MFFTLLVLFSLSVSCSSQLNQISSIYNGKPLQESITNDVLEKSDYPYCVILEYRELPVCGAVIISSSTLLTATHCVYKRKTKHFQIRAGTYWKYDNRPNKVQIRQVSKILQHDEYDDPEFMSNDIALILLSEELHFSRFIDKINLPKSTDQYSMYGETAVLIGWGRTVKEPLIDVLHEVKLISIENDVCNKIMKSVRIKVDSSMICALGKDKNDGACMGDSGSPLVQRGGNGKDILIGLTSFVITPVKFDICDPTYPTVFTNVAALMPWIEENLRKLSSTGKPTKKWF